MRRIHTVFVRERPRNVTRRKGLKLIFLLLIFSFFFFATLRLIKTREFLVPPVVERAKLRLLCRKRTGLNWDGIFPPSEVRTPAPAFPCGTRGAFGTRGNKESESPEARRKRRKRNTDGGTKRCVEQERPMGGDDSPFHVTAPRIQHS